MPVRIAIDLHLFDHIVDASNVGRSITAAELADKSGAEKLLIVRIMRPLVSCNFAKQDDIETYSNTAATRHMTLPSARAAAIFHFDSGLKTIAAIPEYLRKTNWQNPSSVTDGPFQYAFNTSLPSFDYWARDPAMSKNFNTYMTVSQGNRRSWTEWFPIRERCLLRDQSGNKSNADAVLMVDIAGGRGHHLDEFSRAFPDAQGRLILQDLTSVITDCKESLDSRIEKIPVDMFEPQPVLGAKLYHMHHVLHDWPDEPAARILRNIAEAMKPRCSPILVRDYILPDTNPPLAGIGADLTMMLMHAGLERSEKQWHDLVEIAGMGLTIEKVWYSGGKEEGVVEIVRQ